ncbi:MAG: TonB-dependent receptor [Bacteroidales bacterium]|nr:TonB-dependent receptor [Bacteroidales bacterium]
MKLNLLTENFRSRVPIVILIASAILLFGTDLQASHYQTPSKESRVTIKAKEMTLGELLWEIHKQTNYDFVYSTDDIKSVKIGAIDVTNERLEKVLDSFVVKNGLFYEIGNKTITISRYTAATELQPAKKKEQTPLIATGIILDESGVAIIGANIIVKNGTGKTIQGTVSGIDGSFSLQIENENTPVEISCLGFKALNTKINSGQNQDIILAADAQLIDELVITAYGTFKKSAYAGSASNLKADKLKDIPVVSFQENLQGSVAGVQFSSASGQPGASTEVNIRGMGSFNAGNSPLYVIDGIPVASGSVSSMGSDAGLDIMSTINNSDIESMTIIKDAAAASLYGSRAANGVIIINTKRGKSGKAQFNLKADWGFSDFAMQYRPVMNGEQRREYIYNALKNGALRDGDSEEEAIAYADDEIDNYAPVPWCGYIDWDKILFKRGSHQNYELSVSGGSDKFSYYSSLSYLIQDGISNRSALDRITGRLNVDYKATKMLTVGANILFAVVNQDVYSEGTSYTAPFYASRNCVVPSDPIYNKDGSWNRDFIRNSDRNPLLSATYDYEKEKVMRTFNTIYADFEFIKNLKFKTTLSYDITNTKGLNWWDPRTSNGDDVNGRLAKSYNELQKLVWTNQLSYKFEVNRHHFDALAGYEIDDRYSDYLYASKYNFATPFKQAIGNGTTLESIDGTDKRSRLVSYILRLNYDFNDKYYLGGSFRVDGSSKLHRDHRWGKFWSVSGAWRIGNEEFMAGTKNWLSDLKVRASYGVNGTLPSAFYGYMGLSSVTSAFLGQPGIVLSQIANEKLQWETNYNLNLGLDFELFKRLNVTFEYYTRHTKNLLLDCPVSMTTGFSSYLMNVGEVFNRGVELEIKSLNFSTKDFTWNTSLNLSHNKNKILTLDGDQTEIISGTQIRKVGYPYRTFYVYEFAGINPDTGAPQFYTNDLASDGSYIKEVTENPAKANRILYKNADPDLIGGLTNSLSYKWFDLSFMIGFQFGGYSFDNWTQKTDHGGDDLEANIPAYYLDNWKKPGDKAKYEIFIESPDVAMSDYRTSRCVNSTDFIRLKNITFGVSLPKNWVNKVKISNVRFFASANNLLTWAAYDYYDPEAVKGGTAIWGTPPLKTVTFGLNISF